MSYAIWSKGLNLSGPQFSLFATQRFQHLPEKRLNFSNPSTCTKLDVLSKSGELLVQGHRALMTPLSNIHCSLCHFSEHTLGCRQWTKWTGFRVKTPWAEPSSVASCFCCCLSAALCLTLWDPTVCSPPGSSAHGSFHTRTLEYIAISS